MRAVIRIGDMTSHGGIVVSAADYSELKGRKIARKGDLVTCPIPGHVACVIVEGEEGCLVEGKPVALEGHKTSCGAALIASQNASSIG